jgi:chromosome segregation ATPase
LGKANQGLEDAKANAAKLKAANDAANKQIALLQETIEKDKSALAAARTQHATLESTVRTWHLQRELQGRIVFCGRVAVICDTVMVLAISQIKDLTTQLTTARNAADNIKLEWQLDSGQREAQLKELETKRASAVKETKKLSKDNGSLQRQIAGLTQQKAELESNLSRSQKQLKSTEHELKLTKDALKTAEAAVTAGDARLTSITEELQKWKRAAQSSIDSVGVKPADSATSLSRPRSNPTGEFNSSLLPSASVVVSLHNCDCTCDKSPVSLDLL